MSRNRSRAVLILIATIFVSLHHSAYGQLFDGFEGYSLGDIHGQGGWMDFGGTLLTEVSDDRAHTGVHSMKQTINPEDPNPFGIPGYGSDVFYDLPMPVTSGSYSLSYWMYVPTGFDGAAVTYVAEGIVGTPEFDFGPQVAADGSAGFEDFSLSFDEGATIEGSAPLVRDAWVKVEALVDLDANSAEYYYDNNLIFSGVFDSDLSTGSAAGASIGTVNMWVQGGTTGSVYFDDVSIQVVPEPRAASFILLGVVGIAARWRRR